MKVGIDIGGTFTDINSVNEETGEAGLSLGDFLRVVLPREIA